MPVPELAPDPGQRVLHCHVNWVKTHLHNNLYKIQTEPENSENFMKIGKNKEDMKL